MKLRNLLLTVVIGAFALVLVACNNNGGDDEVVGFEHDFSLHNMGYYSIEGNHNFYYVTMDEALTLVENPDFNGVFYFGFPGCPWCQSGVPVLFEAMQETGVPVFYVSRRHDLREGEWNDWDEQMAWWLDEQFPLQWIYTTPGADYTDEQREAFEPEPIRPNIFVPFVVHVRNGVVVDAHRGTFEGHNFVGEVGAPDRHLPELTDEQQATLLATYVRILNGVTGAEPCNILSTTECD